MIAQEAFNYTCIKCTLSNAFANMYAPSALSFTSFVCIGCYSVDYMVRISLHVLKVILLQIYSKRAR